jgi:hypothetical protein
MRLRTALIFAPLVALLILLPIGCSQSTDVKVATPTVEVKPTPLIPASELQGNARKGVGPGSSANMKRDPGASN